MSIDKEKVKEGLPFITIASLSYGLSIVVTKAGINSGLEALPYTFMTMLFVLVFLTPYYLISKKEEIGLKDYRNFFVLGLLASGLAHLFIFLGQQFTSAVNAGFIVKMSTPFTAIFAFFLIGERLRKIDWFAILVAFFGMFLLSTGGEIVFRQGDFLVLLAGLILGFSNVFAKKLMSKHSSGTVVFWRAFFAVIVLFVIAFVFSGNPLGAFGMYAIFNGLLLASTLFFLYKSFDVMGPSISSTLFFMSPIFSTIFAVFLISETIGPMQILGGVIIILGAAIITKRK